MKLTVVIPAYNEEKTIIPLLNKVIEADKCGIEAEIFVVDDGSTDKTTRMLADYVTHHPISAIYLPENHGKGYAIREGLKHATGDIVLIQDADLEYDPAEYPLLLDPIITGKAQVVYGSRIKKRGNPKSYSRYYLGGRLLSKLVNFLYGSEITDEPTGYKVFAKHVLDSINLECIGFEFCPEVTSKILRKNIHIYEVPISYKPRKFEAGKKISWKDGMKAVWILARNRFLRL